MGNCASMVGIAVICDLIGAAGEGRLEEAVRLSDELLASGRGLDSRDQVSTSCAMSCNLIEKMTNNATPWNCTKHPQIYL